MSGSSHSNRPPSSAHRWLKCPGSVALEAEAPEPPSSSYALEGTAAHLLCELRVSGILHARTLTQSVGMTMAAVLPCNYEEYADENEIKDIVITEEMIDAVQEYDIFIRSHLPAGVSALNREFVRLEERVKTKFPGVAGTADCVIVDWPSMLHVIDFKYGTRQVEPEDNPQLSIYALGAIETFGDDFGFVKLSIVQPRGGGKTTKSVEYPLEKFQAKWNRILGKALREIEQKPKLYRHGDWCRYCKGVRDCGRVTRATADLARSQVKGPVPKEAKALSRVLKLETAVLEYLNQAKAAAFEMLRNDESVPGFKLVQTYGRTTWREDHKAEAKLIDALGSRTWATQKLRTPAQLRKIIKKEGIDLDIDALTTTPDRGLKLVPDTDKRPAAELARPVIGDADEEGI